MTKIEQIQKISCLLLDEFARVCNKNGLHWFIDAGSLLGTIRNGGFIEWDEDIDIVMPREDYNRLYEDGSQLFQEPFYLQTSKNCSGDNLTILLKYSNSARLTPRHLTYLYRPYGTRFSINRGIAIDIVPLDYIPEDITKQKYLLSLIRFIYESCDIIEPECQNDHKKLLLLAKYTKGAKLYNDIMTDISSTPTSRMACTAWWMFPNSECYTVSADCYKDYFEAEFRGCQEKVRVPVGYDDILKAYYQDYMTPYQFYQDIQDKAILIDAEHSFREYEKFSNDELLEMIKNNKTL